MEVLYKSTRSHTTPVTASQAILKGLAEDGGLFVPDHIQKKAFNEYGETLEGAAEAIWQFNKEIVDATYDLIPAVKPQDAMYEQYGIEGVKAFK